MTWTRALLASLALASLAGPAPAGFFSRKPKANPAERVPELLLQLRTGQDEAKRAEAAEELRQYDPKAHPEIMTALMDALAKDQSTAVRAEAAASIGKLRPVTQQAGYALEQAVANDSSMRVRMAARQALWQYHLVGYRSGKPGEDTPAKPGEAAASAPTGPSSPAPRQGLRPAGGAVRESPEPPLADPVASQPQGNVSPAPTQPPPGRTPPPLVPVNRPRQPAPATNPVVNRKPPDPPAQQPAQPPGQRQADGPELPPF